jgi:hypothetical protein
MAVYHQKRFRTALTGFALIFAVLFAVRLDLPNKWLMRPRALESLPAGAVLEKDAWMTIYQGGDKIGYSHKRLFRSADGYTLAEFIFMRIRSMGLVQDVSLQTEGRLNPDFTLSGFSFDMQSGRVGFSARGQMDGSRLAVETTSAGTKRRYDLPMPNRPFLGAVLLEAVAARGLKPGRRVQFQIFDPTTMGEAAVTVSVVGEERIDVMGALQPATRLTVTFKGATQSAWVAPNGDVLAEEGLLGIRMERSTRKDALAKFSIRPGTDLTRMASVAADRPIAEPDRLTQLTVALGGIDAADLNLNGGRQQLTAEGLTVRKESLAGLPSRLEPADLAVLEKIFLDPGPLIQSDHPAIASRAAEILRGAGEAPLARARKLVEWVHMNIEKRPVLSVPDALSTLTTREGDCNEHAVLLAALSRAAGIPARIETGLVYLNGRFYYHAWNLLYLGRWITADAVYGQLPADVTHIRLASGTQRQIDLMGVIGRIDIRILSGSDPTAPKTAAGIGAGSARPGRPGPPPKTP